MIYSSEAAWGPGLSVATGASDEVSTVVELWTVGFPKDEATDSVTALMNRVSVIHIEEKRMKVT